MRNRNSVFLNNKFIPAHAAKISISDHGFLYGDGVYETVRVHSGVIFMLQPHLERLKQSAGLISLKLPRSLDYLSQKCRILVQKNNVIDGMLRITLTRGEGPHGFDIRQCGSPTLVLSTAPLSRKRNRSRFRAAVVSIRRNHPACLPPASKSNNCLNGILAKIEATQMGAQEGILLNLDGTVAEGTVSNIFIVKRGILKTPALTGNLLPGVTRDIICQLARAAGIPVAEKQLTRKDLFQADEVFVSNSLLNIQPVHELVYKTPKKIAKVPFSAEKGGLTRRLGAWFDLFFETECRKC